MIYGHEFLGAAKYPKFAIRNLPSGRCGKTFSKEFGPSQPVLKGWAEKGVHPIIATQGLWRGGAHDYSGGAILAEGLKELEKFILIAEAYPKQKFQFSIFCEHKLKLNQLVRVFQEQWELVKKVPNITLVNNPMNGGDLLKPDQFGFPVLNEIHGTWQPKMQGMAPYMWACDGLPAQDCDIQKYKDIHSEAQIIWLWMQQYNCKKKVTDTTPIDQRGVKPIEKQVISLEYLIPNKGATKFNAKSLYKTHADQHYDEPKGREQKPVIITEADATKLEFRASNGEVIAEAPRAGKYTDGRPLYRPTMWGFEIQDRATKLTGNPLVNIVAVRKDKRINLGVVNPAFRENAYRLAVAPPKVRRGETLGAMINISLDWV